MIERQGSISSRDGLAVKPNKGNEDDYNSGNDSEGDSDKVQDNRGSETKAMKKADPPEEIFRKKFATYYSRILFFTFLSKDKITNLEELIVALDNNKDNSRIALHLDLRKDELMHLKSVMDGNKMGLLEFKVLNLNRLEKDKDLLPLERAKIAMRRFSRLSESEITTPENIAKDMVAILPNDCCPEWKYLDIASKQKEDI